MEEVPQRFPSATTISTPYGLPLEAEGAIGYLLEYSVALFWEFVLAWKVLINRYQIFSLK